MRKLIVVLLFSFMFLSLNSEEFNPYKTVYKTKLKDIKADINMIYSDESGLYRSPQYPMINDKVTVKIKTKKNDIDNILLIYKIKDTESNIIMKKVKSDNNFDYYLGVLPEVTGDSTYFFKLFKDNQAFFYTRSGIFVKNPSSSYKFKIFPNFKTPEWMKGAVLYQIYIDRFYNGDKKNDVVTNEYMYDNYPSVSKKWEEYPDSERSYENGSDRTREFFGGDLEGVIQKLSYLKSLGVDGIYFNPIFVSPSNHKYDAQDYENVDPHLGVIIEDDPTLIDPNKDPGYKSKDFNRSSAINKDAKKYITRVTSQKNLDASNKKLEELINKAKDNGIKIILDGVFNHCGSFNKWLNRESIYKEPGAYQSKTSKYANYFKFKEDKWPNNETYDSWWGYKTLPKLYFENSDELVNTVMNIAKKWVGLGVAGWRLDVAADLGYTAKYNHSFWEKFRSSVKSVNKDAVVFAEVYGDSSSWLKGNEWDTTMNYDAFFEPVSFFFTGMEKHSYDYNAKLHNNVTEFDKIMKENMAKMPWQSLEIAMNQLDNHDHSRFITRTNGAIDEGKDQGIRKPHLANENLNKGIAKEAAVFQFTWMGAPTLYYGNEIGLPGWTDPDDRRTFPWGKEDNEMLEFYKKLIRIHKSYSSIYDGSTMTLVIDDKNKVYSYGRWNDNNAVIVALNNGNVPVDVTIPLKNLNLSKKNNLKLIFRSNKDSHSDKIEKISISDKDTITVKVDDYGAVIISCEDLKETDWKIEKAPSIQISNINGNQKEITIVFSEVIDKTTLRDSVSISYQKPLVYNLNGTTLKISPEKGVFDKKQINVKISNKIKSLFGNFTIDKDFESNLDIK